jgi:hypothetical protein
MAGANEENALPGRQFPKMFLQTYCPGYRKKDMLYLPHYLEAAPQTGGFLSPLGLRWTAPVA